MKTTAAGGHMTGMHLFSHGRSQPDIFSGVVRRDWDALPDSEKDTYNKQAYHKRSLASARGSELDLYLNHLHEHKEEPLEGPWNLSSRLGRFPVHPKVIEHAMHGTTMQQTLSKWNKRTEARAMADPSFPDEVAFDGPFRCEIPAALQTHMDSMLETMRLSLRLSCKESDAGLLIEFRHGEHRIYGFFFHTLHLERYAFEAEVFMMIPVYADGVNPDDMMNTLPLMLRYMHIIHETDMPWPNIQSETEFILELLEVANTEWDMYDLTNQPIGLCAREVTARTLIDTQHLKDLERERLQQAVAMKLFRRAAGLVQHKPPKRSVGGRGGGKGRGKAPPGRGSSASPGPSVMSSSSTKDNKKNVVRRCEESSASESDTSESHKMSDTDLKGDIDKKPDPVIGCIKAVHIAKQGERVIEWWDERFPFARIERDGILTGYGVICARHVNVDGQVPNTPCKKSLTIGTSAISEDEARKRLKRWLIVGKIEQLDPNTERQSHVQKGGIQLRDFASDVCGWADLDPDLDILLSTC